MRNKVGALSIIPKTLSSPPRGGEFKTNQDQLNYNQTELNRIYVVQAFIMQKYRHGTIEAYHRRHKYTKTRRILQNLAL